MAYYSKSQIAEKIVKYEAAIEAVFAGQSYTMDSGQGRVTVTRANLTDLQKELSRLVAQYDELDEDRGGLISVRAVR